jgi:hypothetical protein
VSPQVLDPLQQAADEVVSTWPGVKGKNVFGHRGYVRDGHMFAFMAEAGLSFKAASSDSAEAMYAAGSAVPFMYNGTMEMRGWPVLPLVTDSDPAAALDALNQAYEAAA